MDRLPLWRDSTTGQICGRFINRQTLFLILACGSIALYAFLFLSYPGLFKRLHVGWSVCHQDSIPLKVILDCHIVFTGFVVFGRLWKVKEILLPSMFIHLIIVLYSITMAVCGFITVIDPLSGFTVSYLGENNLNFWATDDNDYYHLGRYIMVHGDPEVKRIIPDNFRLYMTAWSLFHFFFVLMSSYLFVNYLQMYRCLTALRVRADGEEMAVIYNRNRDSVELGASDL